MSEGRRPATEQVCRRSAAISDKRRKMAQHDRSSKNRSSSTTGFQGLEARDLAGAWARSPDRAAARREIRQVQSALVSRESVKHLSRWWVKISRETLFHRGFHMLGCTRVILVDRRMLETWASGVSTFENERKEDVHGQSVDFQLIL